MISNSLIIKHLIKMCFTWGALYLAAIFGFAGLFCLKAATFLSGVIIFPSRVISSPTPLGRDF